MVACTDRRRAGRGSPGYARGVDAEALAAAPEPDLDAIARDLADVETALARLADGSYWRDEVTGAPLPDEVLAARPTARRLDDAPPPTAAP